MGKRVDRGPSADVAEIRGQVEAWAEAVRSKDVERVLVRYADDIVLFDVPPPVQSLGIDAYRRSWTDTFFPWFGDAGTFDVSGLEITAGQDVATATDSSGAAARTRMGTAPRSWPCG